MNMTPTDGTVSASTKERNWNVLRGLMSKNFDAQVEVAEDKLSAALDSLYYLTNAHICPIGLSPEVEDLAGEVVYWASDITFDGDSDEFLNELETMESWFWDEVKWLAHAGIIEPHDVTNDEYDDGVRSELFA